MKPQLSLIVPIYNTEKYLKKCIDSIINQKTNYIYEVLLINDGSTDSSQKIIEEYVLKYDFIKGFKKKNKGAADTRNLGISLSSGDYLSFVDSDDTLETCFIQKSMNLIKKQECDLIIVDFNTFFNENKKKLSRSLFIPSNILKNKSDKLYITSVSPCGKIYKKSLFDNIKFPIGIIYEDLAIIPFIVSKAKNIKYLQIPLYNYRLNNEKSVMNNINDKIYDIYKSLNYLYSLFDNRFNEFYDELQYITFDQLVLSHYIRLLQYNKSKYEDFIDIINFMEKHFGQNWMESIYINNKIKLKVTPTNRNYLRYIIPIFIKFFSLKNLNIFSIFFSLIIKIRS